MIALYIFFLNVMQLLLPGPGAFYIEFLIKNMYVVQDVILLEESVVTRAMLGSSSAIVC